MPEKTEWMVQAIRELIVSLTVKNKDARPIWNGKARKTMSDEYSPLFKLFRLSLNQISFMWSSSRKLEEIEQKGLFFMELTRREKNNHMSLN